MSARVVPGDVMRVRSASGCAVGAGVRRRLATAAADEDGIATLVFPLLLWVGVLAAIALVDVAAYLVAATRTQQLADAAALAAVSVDLPEAAGVASDEAARIVAAGGGRLEDCACRTGSERATVTVSLPVPGLFVPRYGAGRVTATARAELADWWPSVQP